MSGIMNKIGDALHIGGDKKKEDEKHKGEAAHGGAEHKGEAALGGAEHKEGIVDKIKNKIHGDGSKEHGQEGEKKKKKKEKKKHDDGHESSSSSDSD
ncbi:hypothetical protein HRI_002216100 [Hibiscus trionum]|uniref:Uncharacterized protein n=1 Tax=Hibiscus trionum TaxID=183268 RepID=A0A9W7HXZ1_HIBTR|nr:hypothetical protein HRI_002216100 [Hibiscus trionum]